MLRLYYICGQSFCNRSGVFTISQLLDQLHTHGHKSLDKKNTSNRARKGRELKELLCSCPELFFHSGGHVFRTISKYKIHRRRPVWRAVPEEILLKKNKRELIDLFLIIPADGKTVCLKTLSKQSGFSKSRIHSAAMGTHQKGHILKINNQVVIDTFKSSGEARAERVRIFKTYGILSQVVKSGFKYNVVINAANSYTSNMMLQPLSHTPQPLFKKSMESNVFIVSKMSGFKTISYFRNDQERDNFFWRIAGK